MCIISNKHYKFIIDSCRTTSVAQYGFLPGNVVARTNDKPLPIVTAGTGVNHSLSTAVLTWMFIRVKVVVTVESLDNASYERQHC